MGFRNIAKVEKYQLYLDQAFKSGKQKADSLREKRFKKTKLEKSVFIETERLKSVDKSLTSNLKSIIKSFPSFQELPVFYQKLVSLTLDFSNLKKSLGGINWAKGRINNLTGFYINKILHCNKITSANKYRREFYGRVSSILKQIKDELNYLEECRKIMRSYPHIKTGLLTVAISGYPNVGKSTLLNRLTGAKPRIASFPFTTKRINLGYLKFQDEKVQFIDIPGTFDRDFNKMNMFEKQAYLVLNHLASLIIFVIDISETCGYTAESQLRLFDKVTKRFPVPRLLILNKIDLKKPGILFKNRNFIPISAREGRNIGKIKEIIGKIKNKNTIKEA